MTIGWCFDNTYSKLPNSFKENIGPVPVKKPKLVILNENLADELKLKGYPIARRTVTKYREELKFPSARQRRQITN